ncbi:hypothetical protein BDR22DRAFT_819887 [Usnea florida]
MVLAARFTVTDGVKSLAGVGHLTVSPPLLQEPATASPSASAPKPLLVDSMHDMSHVPNISRNDCDKSMASFENTDNGERKALDVFDDMQKNLEHMVRRVGMGKRA